MTINPFEYVSILISIILGLGITQILSAVTDLLYNYKKVRFYWPHTLWIIFVMFLHIQDWFITFQLKDKSIWYLPELLFVLLYPIILFAIAKMLLPSHEKEEGNDMKKFYFSQYPVIFFLIAISTLISILFNILLLKNSVGDQILLICFLVLMLFLSLKRVENELIHKTIIALVTLASVISVIVESEAWVIK